MGESPAAAPPSPRVCADHPQHSHTGVRYNAEKMTVGNYYSTPIFKFRMKCHLCENKFEIQTDPKVCVWCVCVVYSVWCVVYSVCGV